MRISLVVATLAVAVAATAVAASAQTGALTSKTDKLQSEVIVSILPTADLTRQITAEKGTIEHKSEVARGGPVAAVVRVNACQKDSAGTCKVNADVVVYKPDGSVFHEVKQLDLPAGRAAVPLTFDAQATTGVYHVVATIRDLTARRFATVERYFGVK